MADVRWSMVDNYLRFLRVADLFDGRMANLISKSANYFAVSVKIPGGLPENPLSSVISPRILLFASSKAPLLVPGIWGGKEEVSGNQTD
ncbi:MAG: hypothetical protein DI535_18070 [Citrobacter freundii]|nr:MAG: hypothetical protein DI535_18070 [Citrobacter freundii]